MFETLKGLWVNRSNNGLTEAMLDKAVTKGWITAEQKTQLMTQ